MTANSGSAAQRRVTADVLTRLGWVHATFHPPAFQTMVDFLNAGHPVLKCTRVRVPTEQHMLPFLALHREAWSVVAPTIDELIEPAVPPRATPRRVRCLLEAGELAGRIDVLENLRVSDHFRQLTGAIVVRQATLRPWDAEPGSPQVRRLAVALVSPARLVGVAEASPAEGADRP